MVEESSLRAAADAEANETREDAIAKLARHDRPSLIVFVMDAETESVLREGLADVAGGSLDVRRGGIRAAIATMRKSITPRTLIIDIGDDSNPLSALASLAEVVEPDVQVLVIGVPRDVDFYRQVTRGLGGAEYLPKPLTRDMVLRHFAPLVAGHVAPQEAMQGGRFITVTGVRGGVGATTVAAYLAWHFAIERRRHTVLLDADLHLGNAAMLLGVKVNSGLRTAMENPARIDELFIERSAQTIEDNPAAERLGVLAGEERLADEVMYSAGAATRLIRVLQKRYNFVVGDIPPRQAPQYKDLIGLAQQRILVMEPSLAAIRDTLRLVALPNGAAQTRRSIIVLNRADRAGGLTRSQVEQGLKMRPDVIIPDLPKQVGPAATLGSPQTAMRGGFRASIVALAREAAYERLLDGPEKARGEQKRRDSDPAKRQPPGRTA